MSRRMTLTTLVWLVAFAPAALAATTTAPAPARARTVKASAPGSPAAKGAAQPRRLEDVKIEGEIPVPQVLFVTAREQRRLMELQHHRYLRSSRELAAATPLPRWTAVPQVTPTPERSR